ncbi:hypothetical protein F8M41_005862 [Gigaspora margarita]|uniref:Uncharacterized protein n=1 Tax=Gigaspora margarita TaxID=4874 RepID=A0A8H3X7F9_GIGMA|nr:hypothetical protein F8M41_005862 [Gigaspora margarita]
MSALNSGWQSAVKKAKKIGNKVDKIVHNYPKLPEFPLGYESLPFQIGKNVSMKSYNTFLDRSESSGYKFRWENRNVYIIEMADLQHEAAVSVLFKYFDRPNNGAIRGPISVYGQPYHYNPTGNGEKIAPDIAVRGSKAHILPSNPHPGLPPGDVKGNPHARIICEVAHAQNINAWNTKCEVWMYQTYVRCLLGIKLFPKIHARLWTRVALPGSVLSTDATLATAGVHVTEWDFGTIQFNTHTPTGCTAPNLINFQVTIPITDVFWDPPIVGGVPTPFAVFMPGTVVGTNFMIDLFDVQQEVLDAD